MLPLTEVLRLARALHSAWRTQPQSSGRTPIEEAWCSLDEEFAELQRARYRVELATAKNLALTLPRLKEQLTVRLIQATRQFEQLRGLYAPTAEPPDLGEWIREVRQLEAEFGAVEVRWTDRVIVAVTEPIELRGIALGSFAIEFDWQPSHRARGAKSFAIIALQPNTPTGREDITHPHVQDGVLCAGDAVGPLERALADGHLTDAFLLVQSVLVTYNANSPYIPLSEWDGTLCGDCGRRVDRESRYTCEHCERDLCDECAETCSACSETRCADCMEPCDVCQARHCRGSLTDTDNDRSVCSECLITCARCEQSIPKDELDAHTQHCSSTETKEVIDGGASAPEATAVAAPTDFA
jgi:hypothetical protein